MEMSVSGKILFRILIAVPLAVGASPSYAGFAFCHAHSIKARNVGPIVTSIQETGNGDMGAATYGFTGFLRSSYAPYGNNWAFAQGSARCEFYQTNQEAERRMRDIVGPYQQAGELVFNVPYQIPR